MAKLYLSKPHALHNRSSMTNLDDAWSFSAELSPEGLIGIAESIQRYVVFTNHF